MDALVADRDGYTLRLGSDEVILLCEVLGRAEWADDLEVVEVRSGAERKVMTDLMLALRAGVPELGTDAYGQAVRAAEERIAGAG
jgi:hypothetical protein